MNKKPIIQKTFYKSTAPKGYHTVSVWQSEKKPKKYSFCCSYANGVMATCEWEHDSMYTFGFFDTPKEALEAGKKIVFS